MRGFGIPPRIIFHNPDEQLSGVVQGLKASDLEERTARSLDRLSDWHYQFRVRINPLSGDLSRRFTNLKGELEIDFLLQRGRRIIPVLVDGEIGHFFAQWQKELDAEKTEKINQHLKPYGAQPAVRVEYWRLANQEMSDQYYRRLLT